MSRPAAVNEAYVPSATAPLPFLRDPVVLRRALYFLILVACALRVWEVVLHNPLHHIFSDTQRHWDHGRNALESAPMVLFDPPLFQMWLSLVQKWALGVPGLFAFYAAVMSIATPWLWYRFLREALASRELALLGWALLAWLPSWISIFSYFMSETLFLPLLGASLWQTLRARRKQTLGAFGAMVVLWSLAALTRGIAAPFAGLAGAWVWWAHPQKWRAALLGAAIAAFAAVPFAIRNHEQVGLWSPFGNGWLNSIYAASGKQNIVLHLRRDGAEWGYVFGSPSMYVPQFRPLTEWSPKREGTVEIRIDLRQGSADWEREAARTALPAAAQWRLRADNFLLAIAGESWPDNNRDYLAGRASLDARWIWLPLLLALAGVAVRRVDAIRRAPLVPALILCWILLQGCSLLAINEGRYRKPLEGFLIAQALLFLDWRRAAPRPPAA